MLVCWFKHVILCSKFQLYILEAQLYCIAYLYLCGSFSIISGWSPTLIPCIHETNEITFWFLWFSKPSPHHLPTHLIPPPTPAAKVRHKLHNEVMAPVEVVHQIVDTQGAEIYLTMSTMGPFTGTVEYMHEHHHIFAMIQWWCCQLLWTITGIWHYTISLNIFLLLCLFLSPYI